MPTPVLAGGSGTVKSLGRNAQPTGILITRAITTATRHQNFHVIQF